MATTRWASTGRYLSAIFVALMCTVAPSGVTAQPAIDHPGIECIAPGRFAVILSGIEPDLEVQTAKVYFRSNLYPDYYYVEMTYENGRFQGILPQPSPETTQVIYYLEAIDGVFNGTRSIEWGPLVEDCDDDPAAAYFTSESAGIVVGATTASQSAIPAGFSAAGIVGTIAATGVATGVGGGVGAGTAVAVGAVAAGAAGAAVATAGGDDTPAPAPTTVIAVVTTSVPASTTVGPSPDPGPSTTVPAPMTTTVLPGTTTTSTGGSTTTSAGGGSTSTTSVATTSIPTTISTTTIATTSVALPPLDASCFTMQVLGDCRVRVDATCVSAPVDRYDWVLDVDDRWQRITMSNGPSIVVQNWSSSCDEDNETIRFRLTVHRGADSDTATKSINVPGNDLKTLPDGTDLRVRFESSLEIPALVRGRISSNDTFARMVESNAPVRVEVGATRGINRVSGALVEGSEEPGVWRFDFANEPKLEHGSLRVIAGDVVSLGSTRIVFRVNGSPGERVEFQYSLRP